VPSKARLIGLTRAEVRALVGSPHQSHRSAYAWPMPGFAASCVGSMASPLRASELVVANIMFLNETEIWMYRTGWSGIGYIGLEFDVAGKVRDVFY
jgi:hypothetical protein